MDKIEDCLENHNFSVMALKPTMVSPSEPTPNEVLYLSNMDDQSGVRMTCQTLHVYAANSANSADPVKVIRHALSKALVYYYPLAGRLRKTNKGKLEANCTGEGAVCVEADANCSLQKLGYLEQIISPFFNQLIYEFPVTDSEYDNIHPLVVQVTRFTCGGFIVGLGLSHCMIDGIGFSQFLQALAELARGMAHPSVSPAWHREILRPRDPPLVEFPHNEFIDIGGDSAFLGEVTSHDRVLATFGIAAPALNKLKQYISQLESSAGCSTFEALAAFVWKSRTKALGISFDQQVKLMIAVNVRKIYNPPLPQGYYGNGFFCACVMASSTELVEASLSDVVKLIKKTKVTLTNDYLRSAIDFLEEHR